MIQRIRVKDPTTGHEYDVPASRLSVCPELVVLSKPTGPTKPRLPLGTPIPGGEVALRRAAAKQEFTAAPEPVVEENDGQSVATEEE